MARQKLPATAVAVSLVLLTTGEHAVAQSASELEMRLHAGSARTSGAGIASLYQNALTPSLRFENTSFTLHAGAAALSDGFAWTLGDAAIRADSRHQLSRSVRAEFAADASRIALDGYAPSQQLDITGRLHLIRERGGAWLGSGVIRPLRVATVSNASVSSGGVWTKVHDLTLRASVTTTLFTRFATNDATSDTSLRGVVTACPVNQLAAVTLEGSAPLPSSCRRESRVTDIETGLNWERRRVEVSLRGGQRFGHRLDVSRASRYWGSAQGNLWLTSQLAAVIGGGREPGQPTRGLPARSYASLGFMLAYWPIPRGTVLVESPANLVKSFELKPAGEALQRLTVRIGRVERVEVMGDFSDWAPVPLERRGRDLWELFIPMGPGMHQINMRIDGGRWIAPPGIPSIRDDFNGQVGVLVIKG